MLLNCGVGEDSWESLEQQRSKQSILKEISPEYSLEGQMLKLKVQYFGHLMGRTDSFKKILMLGKIEGGRRKGRQKIRWLDGITDLMDMSLSWWWTGKIGVVQSMRSQRVRHDWVIELNWTELIILQVQNFLFNLILFILWDCFCCHKYSNGNFSALLVYQPFIQLSF